MVAIVKRMRKLNALLAIKVGPGAAILPPEVTRIHMDFAAKLNDGHMGPRKFWQNCLPRLKYHNPTVTMTVNRTTNQEGPALMTVHFTNNSSAKPEISSTTTPQTSTAPTTPTTPGPSTERTETIHMKHRTDSEILAQLLDLTKAKELEATEEEMALITELEEQKAKADADAARQLKVNEEIRKSKAMLAAARGEGLEANADA